MGTCENEPPTNAPGRRERDLVEQTIAEVCAHRGWHLYVAKARTNHVHVAAAANKSPERVMNDFKTWTTRRLRENSYVTSQQTVWGDHGSTPYLWTEAELFGAID